MKRYIAAEDGFPLLYREWLPETADDNGTVFLGHSNITHSGILADLAMGFVRAGFRVCSGDVRGHGLSVNAEIPRGHARPKTGWSEQIGDIRILLRTAFKGVEWHKRLIVVPNVCALLTLEVLQSWPDLAENIVLISPPPNQPLQARLGLTFAKVRSRLRNPAMPDEQMRHHIFSFLGASLRNREHLLDVMSSDRDTVNRVLADPLCWPVISTSGWEVFFAGLLEVWQNLRPGSLLADTRFLVLYGEEDQMMRNGAFIGQVTDRLVEAGSRNVSSIQVPGGRTALFLEEPRLGIVKTILGWLRAGRPEDEQDRQQLPARKDIGELARLQLRDLGSGSAENNGSAHSDFIQLCYEAVQDETRWIEVIYRLVVSADNGSESQDLEALLQEVMPHMERAFSLQQKLLEAATLGSVFDEILQRLGAGVALVDGYGRPVYVNQSFQIQLFRLLRNVELTKPQDNSAVEPLLREILQENLQMGRRLDSNGTILTVHGEPLGYYFTPDVLQANAEKPLAPQGVVILRPASGGSKVPDKHAILELAFGLTKQEAMVASHVMEGLSPQAIAEREQLSIHTVRSHLARCYEKLGVADKTELAARLLASPAGWLDP